jgi:glutathione synthase/RimK-type ligase-like ATP-grasp enzyme
MSDILIVSNPEDLHADYMVDYLQNKGEAVFRWHPASIDSYQVTLTTDGVILEIEGRLRPLEMRTLKSVWISRPFAPSYLLPRDAGLHEKVNAAECDEIMKAVFHEAQQARWYSRPASIQRAERKGHQLQMAAKAGFRIPRYCISSSYSCLSSFVDQAEREGHDLVLKPVGAQAAELLGGVLVTRFKPEEVRNILKNWRNDLLYLQYYIQKDYDVRVTTVGTDTFASTIRSRSELYAEDWRGALGESKEDLQYDLIDVPDDVEKAMQSYLHEMQLNFGAWDFSLVNGIWYFLECNPNGRWLWIQFQTGAPLLETFGDHLRGLRTPIVT